MRYLFIVLSFLLSMASTTAATEVHDSLWYKKAVIYSVDVEVFKDSDNDNTGDFKGLVSNLIILTALALLHSGYPLFSRHQTKTMVMTFRIIIQLIHV